MMLRRGRWGHHRILSEDWIARTMSPCEVNPGYGYLFWLNRPPKKFPSLPESSFFAIGAGYNVIWMDPDRDLVVVARWIAQDRTDELFRCVLAAIR
jgi:CubicO group peptidase (beta-lactamase class C family)